jgi:PEP-CTERM motif-containing protein
MRPTKVSCGALVITASLFLPQTALATPIRGQIDTFEDLTTQGWSVNLFGGVNNNQPSNTTGGPGGAADHYLSLTSIGGNGPASKMSVFNADSRWTGDYIAAGVNAITMDLLNLGQTDLYLRLMFEDPMFGPPTNVAFSTQAIFLAAGSGWTAATFLIGPGDLTAGLGSVNAALMGATTIRLYHSQAPGFPNPAFPIQSIVAQLGVDNIAAAAVPEPASLLLLGTGLVAVRFAARKTTRR